MALTKCKECSNKVSNKADICPHCGVKLNQGKNIVTQLFSALLTLATLIVIAVFWIGFTASSLEQPKRSKDELIAELNEIGRAHV